MLKIKKACWKECVISVGFIRDSVEMSYESSKNRIHEIMYSFNFERMKWCRFLSIVSVKCIARGLEGTYHLNLPTANRQVGAQAILNLLVRDIRHLLPICYSHPARWLSKATYTWHWAKKSSKLERSYAEQLAGPGKYLSKFWGVLWQDLRPTMIFGVVRARLSQIEAQVFNHLE